MRTRTVLLAVAGLTMGAIAIGLPALGDNGEGNAVDVTGLHTHEDQIVTRTGPRPRAGSTHRDGRRQSRRAGSAVPIGAGSLNHSSSTIIALRPPTVASTNG